MKKVIVPHPKFQPYYNNKVCVFFAVLVIIIGILMFASCNIEKIAIRKDAKAVDRVKGSRTLIDKIAPIINELYPCNRDTVIKIKSDTVTHYDTTNTFTHYTDSINKTDTVLRKIVITKTIHDTIKIVTDSKQRAAIDGVTISTLNTALSASNQAVIDAEGATRKADKWLWWFIGAIVLLVGSNGIWIYSKFKL